MDNLAGEIGAILTQLTNSGAQMPILLACVSVNGSMLYCRYTRNDEGAADSDVLAQMSKGLASRCRST